MRYYAENDRIVLPVTELAAYASQRGNADRLAARFGFTGRYTEGAPDAGEVFLSPENEGNRIHSNAETDSSLLPSAYSEVPLEYDTETSDGTGVTVSGRADTVFFDGVMYTVEEIKTVSSLSDSLNPLSYPEHFAQAVTYAFMLSEMYGTENINIRLTYISRGRSDRLSFEAVFPHSFTERMFFSLLGRAEPFILFVRNRSILFPSEAAKMPFPYPEMREGQNEYIQDAYKCFKNGGSLLVSAPTGIGKTISALFPAVKALGKGFTDRVFYLTAKTVTGDAALDAVGRMVKYVPHLFACMLQSKTALCPVEHTNRPPCRGCPLLDSSSDDEGREIPWRERELSALSELLTSGENIFTSKMIKETAAKYGVCPHELSLDLSEYCMVIVCDYNYVTDDRVRLKRYFEKQRGEQYAFLFDEAHNLPDRIRDMYSAKITSENVRDFTETVRECCPDAGKLMSLAEELADVLSEIKKRCTDYEWSKGTGADERSGGYFESDSVPPKIRDITSDICRTIRRMMFDGTYESGLDPFYELFYSAASASAVFDRRFRFLASRENDSVTLSIICIDPSELLESKLETAKSVILFSATLEPIEYYRDITGLKNADILSLPSPYDPGNLCITAFDSINTRLNERKNTANDCAELIEAVVSAREGNYIAYFPSYEYMKRVCTAFHRLAPEYPVILQKPGMSYGERERFIKLFRSSRYDSIVGFCVLGGIFSEGIDLAGESLIGTIIFGTGIPSLSAERNIMSNYYDERTERGFDYAYACPGMNRVLQAAGRVIRTETDRGVVVLVDDRLRDPAVRKLFPKHWKQMKYTGNIASLSSILDDFWNR